MCLDYVPQSSHRLSGFTRHPPVTSKWPNWNWGVNNVKGIGIQISDQMVSGGDYRYANHHHDPSAVTDVMS